MNVYCQETNLNGFELYFFNKNVIPASFQIEKICKVYPNSNLYSQINALYNDASESSRHLKLSDTVLSTIQEYIELSSRTDEDFLTENLPF